MGNLTLCDVTPVVPENELCEGEHIRGRTCYVVARPLFTHARFTALLCCQAVFLNAPQGARGAQNL